MKTAGIERSFGGGSRQGGKINPGRWVTVRHNRLGAHPALVTPYLHRSDHTQLAALHILNGIFKMLLAALPLTSLHHFVIPLLRRYHKAAFTNGITYRFFNIYIFAR